jgi:electron transport complex protein RnfD
MSPFKSGKENIFHTQSTIIIALIPIIIWGAFVFGGKIFSALIISSLTSVFVELIFFKLSHQIKSFSILRPLIIGIISALILPVSSPFWCFSLCGFISSVIFLISFRGPCDCNIINPICASGIIMYELFENVINNFTAPFETLSFFENTPKDSIFITTVLQTLKNGTDSITNTTLLNVFLGRDSGALGEVSTLLILIGGMYLVYKKYTSWHIPVAVISTVFLISFFFPTGNCEAIYCATVETMSGGVVFYAFFVATLPSASPITKSGRLFFGVAVGVTIMILRRFTPVADGAVFAVGLISCFSGLIDRFSGNKYFSYYADSKKEEKPAKTDLEALLKDE